MLSPPNKKSVPAFLSIDVEPDAFQVSSNSPVEWEGHRLMAEFIESFRSRLQKNSVSMPRFGWYFRTDPQIEEIFGTSSFAMTHAPEFIESVRRAGDYFGIHPHPLRWSPAYQKWIHEFEDARWLVECTKYSMEVFSDWAGEQVIRTRYGAGFLTNDIIDTFAKGGVRTELTLEPVSHWGVQRDNVPTSIDSSPMVGRYTDCGGAPRSAYRPAEQDFRIPDNTRDDGIVMIPLSSINLADLEPTWKKIARRLIKRPSREKPKMLYMTSDWGTPKFYWDLVEKRLREMDRPYLSIALRTDRAELTQGSRVRRILEYLPEHPLSYRLRFIDPVEVASELVR